MRSFFCVPLYGFLISGWLCVFGWAQSGLTKAEPELAPASFGTVTGHVYLAGSDTPARLVNVSLQPLHFADEMADYTPGKTIPLPVTVYQTALDGGYTMPRVAPGTYYVSVNAPGMLSPFGEFTKEELRNPTPVCARGDAGGGAGGHERGEPCRGGEGGQGAVGFWAGESPACPRVR